MLLISSLQTLKDDGGNFGFYFHTVVLTIILLCGFTFCLSVWVIGFVLGSEKIPYNEEFVTKSESVTRFVEFKGYLAA